MSADLLARLIEAGTPAALVGEVAMQLARAEAVTELVEQRRAKDRARKAIPRNSTESEESAEIHTETLSPHPPPKVSPTPPTNTPPIPPIPTITSQRAKAFHRLPESWQPRLLPVPVQAKVDLWPPGALGDELAGFRRWAANAEDKNGKGRKLDWDQAWRAWIARRHDERYSRQIQHHSHLGKSGLAYAMQGALSDDLPM